MCVLHSSSSGGTLKDWYVSHPTLGADGQLAYVECFMANEKTERRMLLLQTREPAVPQTNTRESKRLQTPEQESGKPL